VRRVVLLGALSLAACDGTTQPGPTVTVLRVTSTACLDLLTDTPPSSVLGLADPCSTTPVTAPLLAGIDQVELVIDYGEVAFTASTTIPPPTVSVEVDGKPSMTSASVAARPQLGGHAWFVATFTAPNVVSNNVQVEVDVATGYSTRVTKTFQTVAPTPAVSVLRKTSAGCFAAMTPVVPDPMLGLASPCGTGSATLNAAVDLVELVIDYGVVDVSQATVPPSPSIAVSVDSTAVATPVALSSLQRVHGHLFYVATFHAPPLVSNNVRITLTTVGIGTTLDTVFSTVAPVPAVDVVECAGLPTCDVRGAVGTIHLHVMVPGDVPQQVAFHSYLDEVPGPDLVSPSMTTLGTGNTETTVEVPVPAAPAGTAWSLEAQLGSARARSRSITVQKPQVTAGFACTQPCVVAAGAALGLTITAPKDIRTKTAIYTTWVDGVPLVSNATTELVSVDVGAGTVSGTVSVTAPPHGAWRIDVSVAGYRADSIVVQVP
jgi:hypothetical protein